jgi:hypothetical protein
VRFWTKNRLLRAPVPLTGSRALSAAAPHGRADWMVAFLEALASEATDYMEMLRSLERGWSAARARVPAQRSTSRAALAVDVMAATPLISATTLAGAIGMSIKCTTDLLDRFVVSEIAVEVTHRSARRLFGLAEMAPVRAATTAPRRPIPGRGRGGPGPKTSKRSWLRRPRRCPRCPVSNGRSSTMRPSMRPCWNASE